MKLPIFYRDGSHDRIGRSVDDRDVVTKSVGDVDPSAVRGYRHTVRGTPYRDGGHNRIGGGVDDRDVVAGKVGDVGAGAVRSYRYAVRGIPDRDGGHDCISGGVDAVKRSLHFH